MNDFEQALVFQLIGEPLDFESQVGAVEARGNRQRVVQPEQTRDIVCHQRCCRCRERCNNGALALLAQLGDEIGDSQVRRAEILPPLGDAMRFVYSHERDARIAGE